MTTPKKKAPPRRGTAKGGNALAVVATGEPIGENIPDDVEAILLEACQHHSKDNIEWVYLIYKTKDGRPMVRAAGLTIPFATMILESEKLRLLMGTDEPGPGAGGH